MLHFYYRVTNQNMNDFLCSTVSPLFISLISELIAMLHDLRKKNRGEKNKKNIFPTCRDNGEFYLLCYFPPALCWISPVGEEPDWPSWREASSSSLSQCPSCPWWWTCSVSDRLTACLCSACTWSTLSDSGDTQPSPEVIAGRRGVGAGRA